MKKCSCSLIAGTLALAGLLGFSACSETATVCEVELIPLPNQVEVNQGTFVLKNNAVIGYTEETLAPAAGYLARMLSTATGYTIRPEKGKGDINLSLRGEGKDGGYTLNATSRGVDIAGTGYGGVIAGIETLRQLFPAAIESKQVVTGTDWAVPAVNITDAPRYEWRGLMLDVSRHFYDADEVKELLDLMAFYKMNKFHWHLTDDQGWRIEIKQYPLLTEKGAWRKFNSHDRDCMIYAREQDNPDYEIPQKYLHIENGDTLYGGFYTQDQIRDIVNYAAVRGIDVLPEVDMPGHMLAAVSNYKGVACTDKVGWGATFSSPVCPGKDSAIEFCQNVYKEIFALFPYKYVHIGGDEVEKTNWKKCPDCQRRMRENNLKNEEELQAWFTHTMEKFFNENGKEMIGWDEIIEGGLSETSTVMWWRSWSKDASKIATAHGNKVIYTPNAPFYLDYQQDKKSVINIYNYEPELEGMTDAQKALIMGVQGNIWCEWIPSRERMQYMAAPRMLAIAELGWSDPAQKDWNGFTERMAAHFDRLNVMNVNYRIPDLEGFYETNTFIGEGKVTVNCLDKSASIYYTTDGSIPTPSSARYEGPVTITESTDFTFRTFRPNGKKGDIVKTRYIKSEYAPAAEVKPEKTGLKAVWYDFKGNKCSEITKAPLKGEYETASVMIPEGVSGNIGLVITGYIQAPKDGIYTFALLSDDGSVLTVDEETVVDNDGPHSPREQVGQKALKAGYHPVAVRYFDSNGGTLSLKVLGEDGKELPVEGLFAH